MCSVDECLHIAASTQAIGNGNSTSKVLSEIFINDIDCVVCITNVCSNMYFLFYYEDRTRQQTMTWKSDCGKIAANIMHRLHEMYITMK